MRSPASENYIVKGVFMLLLVGSFIGCQSVFNPYVGKAVKENSRISLMGGGPHQGFWSTDDLSFQFTYVKGADKLEISGDLRLDSASCWNYEILDMLSFRINFIDSDGKLIESTVFWGTVSVNQSYEWAIKPRTLSLPPDTAAMGFSYVGSLRQGGGDGTELDLWCSPLGK